MSAFNPTAVGQVRTAESLKRPVESPDSGVDDTHPPVSPVERVRIQHVRSTEVHIGIIDLRGIVPGELGENSRSDMDVQAPPVGTVQAGSRVIRVVLVTIVAYG